MISTLFRLAHCFCLLLAFETQFGPKWSPASGAEASKKFRLLSIDDEQPYRLSVIKTQADWMPSSVILNASSTNGYSNDERPSSSFAPRHFTSLDLSSQTQEPKRRFFAKRSQQSPVMTAESLIFQSSSRPIEGKSPVRACCRPRSHCSLGLIGPV